MSGYGNDTLAGAGGARTWGAEAGADTLRAYGSDTLRADGTTGRAGTMDRTGTTDPGDRSAAEIERDVERTRAGLTRTLDELRDRLSPGQVVDQFMDYVRGSGGVDFARNLGTQVRDNPLPVLLIGAGVGWLALGGGRPRTVRHEYYAGTTRLPPPTPGYDEYEQSYYAGEVAGSDMPSSGGVAAAAARARDAATGAAGRAGDAASSAYHATADAASSAYQTTRDAASSAYHATADAASSAYRATADAASAAYRGVAGAAQGVGSGGAYVARNLGENPWPLALIGAGLAWMMLGGRGHPSRLYHGVDERMRSASGRLSGAAGQVGGAASSAYGAASSAYEGARSAAGSAYEGTTEAAHRAGSYAQDTWSRMVNEQPLVLGAVGLAIGAAIGAALPRTRAEDRVMGESSDELARQAKALAADAADEAKHRAGEQLGRVQDAIAGTVEDARDRAERSGVSVRDTGAALGRVAGEIGEAIRDAVHDAASEAKDALERSGGERDEHRTEVVPERNPPHPPTGPVPDVRRTNPL
jgi:hypothetical protein